MGELPDLRIAPVRRHCGCVALLLCGLTTGAKPSETAVLGSLTQNLNTMLTTFYRPSVLANTVPSATDTTQRQSGVKRRKIVYEQKAFPSDLYALKSACLLHGLDPDECLVPIKPREGEATLRTEDIVQVLAELEQSGDGALLVLGAVQYFTGQLFDIATITSAAHKAGMIVGIDAAHAFANTPLALHDWGVDFAVWCSYKYGCAGPGGIGGLFVHERWGDRPDLPRMSGWWGHDEATRFAMFEDFVQLPGAAGWQMSNPSILDLAALRGSLETLCEVLKLTHTDPQVPIGSDEDAARLNAVQGPFGPGRIMPHLRKKSERLTSYLLLLLRSSEVDILKLGMQICLITPSDPQQRGSQVCIQIRDTSDAKPSVVSRALTLAQREHGLVADIRKPDVIRMAPSAHYNTYTDVLNAAKALHSALRTVQAQ